MATTGRERRVVIRLRNGTTAELTDEWRSTDVALQHQLNALDLDVWPPAVGYDPDPLLTLARQACKDVGAKLVAITPQPAPLEGQVD